MTLKEKILLDLAEIKNPSILNQIFEFIQLVKKEVPTPIQEQNKKEVFQFVGVLSDEDAREINGVIDSEFNNIEGEW